MRVLPCVLLALLLGSVAHAGPRLWEMQGREFWVVFEENEGPVSSVPYNSFRLYLISPHQSYVTVAALNSAFSTTIVLAPGVMQEVVLPDDVELLGSEHVDNRTIHVTASNDIACLALNSLYRSSDAFLCVPVPMLDTAYTVLAYPANWHFPAATPSQFALVATVNNTVVRITPSANTAFHSANQAFRVTLQRGEAYQVQSELPTGNGALIDLTGTRISATAPIGVVAGQKRANVPYTASSTQDFMCEYLVAAADCDTSFIVAPHAVAPQVKSVFRVMAGASASQVSIDGGAPQTLFAGAYLERPLTSAHRVHASAPVIVASYEQSDVGSAGNRDDPFMMLQPSIDRFRNAYHVAVPDASDFSSHWLTMVIPTGSTGTLRVDGAAVATAYAVVPGTSYSVGSVVVAAGGHVVTCGAPFGLSSEGVGVNDSYGAPAGFGAQRHEADVIAPRLAVRSVACDSVQGWGIDDQILDTGIDSIYLVDSLSDHAVLMVPGFLPGVDSAVWTLVWTAKPAHAELAIRDRSLNVRQVSLYAPTVRIVSSTGGIPDRHLFYSSECDTIVLRAMGSVAETVTALGLQNGSNFGLTVLDALPKTLRPGIDSLRAVICPGAVRTLDSDLVMVTTGSCGEEGALVVEWVKEDRCRPVLRRGSPGFLRLTPNPASGSGRVIVQCVGLPAAAGSQLQLTDMYGRTQAVWQSQAGASWTIETGSLAAGVYGCSLRSGERIFRTSLVIVR